MKHYGPGVHTPVCIYMYITMGHNGQPFNVCTYDTMYSVSARSWK